MAKISNKELHDCVVKMMDLEEKLLMEEMKDAQPHVFSKEFERKMQEVMRVQARVNKRSDLVRYLATAAVVILIIFGLLFIGNEDLRASEFKINILEWFEKVEEEITFAVAFIKYENELGDTLVLQVFREKAISGMDGEGAKQDIDLNQAGFEYRWIYKEDTKEFALTWLDEKQINYDLSGTVELHELIKCMNSISY